MLSFNERRETTRAAGLLYNAVADVAAYPQFLPWCVRATACEPPLGQGGARVGELEYWRLAVGLGPLAEEYVSRVRLNEGAGVIEATAVAGALKHLQTRWSILPCDARKPLTSPSQVEFEVEFSFGKRLLDRAAERLFAHAVARMVRAFEARADFLAAGVPQIKAPTEATKATGLSRRECFPPQHRGRGKREADSSS